MKAFLLILFLSIPSFSCDKEIKVDIIYKKVIPSVLDWSHKTYTKKNQTIKISCELYKNISVGDMLEPADKDDLEFNLRDALFNSPVEEVKYLVIKK